MSLAERAKRLAGQKILTFDIETSPHNVYTWGLWDQNVSIKQIVEPGRVICWGAKWHGSNKVLFASDHHDGHESMIQQIWDLLNDSDITIGFNQKRFDLRHLHREFWLAGLPMPSPHKDVDLLTEVRRSMLFPSNKLDYVSQQVGIGQKVKHEGFDLWTACMAGDEAAWKRMRTYCVGDVRLTEKLYDRMAGWIPGHPHAKNGTADDRATCNQCHGSNLERNGITLADQISYQLWRCLDCGANVKSTRHNRAAISRGAR